MLATRAAECTLPLRSRAFYLSTPTAWAEAGPLHIPEIPHSGAEGGDGTGRVGVLYLDLDGFKPVNDTLGHGAGDEVLVAVARRLDAAVRDGDLVARLGGDEFAVLCPTLTGTGELEVLAQRLVDVVALPFEVRGEQVTLGVSIGASIGTSGTVDGDGLVEAADRALYRVKRAAKGGWEISSSDSLAGARLSSLES